MTDTGTKEKMVFSFNRWLSRDMDDGDMVRELPVVRTGKPIPMCKITGCMPSSGYVNKKYEITHWWQRFFLFVFLAKFEEGFLYLTES